jgi:hypothetical protein
VLTRSASRLAFGKDDVSCLDMPTGHTRTGRGIEALALFRGGGRVLPARFLLGTVDLDRDGGDSGKRAQPNGAMNPYELPPRKSNAGRPY